MNHDEFTNNWISPEQTLERLKQIAMFIQAPIRITLMTAEFVISPGIMTAYDGSNRMKTYCGLDITGAPASIIEVEKAFLALLQIKMNKTESDLQGYF